ncbi:MAG: 50S ribosomal protein L20 [Anaeroplasmataceae bacterium]|nr:50S ribosomal protein L20 [Anaeroplasmataceae bacterium]MDE5868105.1 50S ribosomal protein L20 [Anaeroplasmataceae bacterium]
MPRVKGGYVTRRRRKAVLKLAKGYYGSKHALYKTAHEQVMRSLAYSYRDRKARKRDFRKLWISRINAACQLNDMKYSLFINGLAKAGIAINRKMLAEMAVNDPAGFAELCNLAKKALEKKTKAEKAENVVFLKPLPKHSK